METALKTSDVLARLNISEDTLYALIAAKRIRAVRLGRQYRFDAEAVEEFMRQKKTVAEVIEKPRRHQSRMYPVPTVIQGMEPCTYFLQRQSGGPIKIGKSENFKSRLSSLQGGNPERLVCLCRLRGNQERELHHRFRHLRISGEWFRPEADLMEFVNAKKDSSTNIQQS